MTRYHGKIGYGSTEEVAPGVFEDVITERSYTGDLTMQSRTLDTGDQVNDDISVGNDISIVADAFAYEHYFQMRYAQLGAVRWKIQKVEVRRPRLLLSLGGIYNGPTPE